MAKKPKSDDIQKRITSLTEDLKDALEIEGIRDAMKYAEIELGGSGALTLSMFRDDCECIRYRDFEIIKIVRDSIKKNAEAIEYINDDNGDRRNIEIVSLHLWMKDLEKCIQLIKKEHKRLVSQLPPNFNYEELNGFVSIRATTSTHATPPPSP